MMFVCDLGHEIYLYHAFWVRKLFSIYQHAELSHHYGEGIFILIQKWGIQEFRKLKTTQPRTEKLDLGSKVSDTSNLLITSWEDHVCAFLAGWVPSPHGWTQRWEVCTWRDSTGVRVQQAQASTGFGLHCSLIHINRDLCRKRSSWILKLTSHCY